MKFFWGYFQQKLVCYSSNIISCHHVSIHQQIDLKLHDLLDIANGSYNCEQDRIRTVR